MPDEPQKDEVLEAYKAAYRIAFGGPSGEMVLEHLTNFCGVFGYNPGTNGIELSRSEGRRDVGLLILMMVGDIKTQKGNAP